MFKKIGECIDISPANIQTAETVVPNINPAVLEEMKKFAASLKRIAPKAEDFLYFSAVFMHAAEASSINEDGTPKLTKSGQPVEVGWDKKGGTWRWITNDPSIKPTKNANGDIFPASELVLAHKKWVGKPLCIDHKSSSVDHVRGFIVDTYYDHNLKRVIGLCALDKHNYPDLARKVSTGYSNSVSMGTAVERAICFDCGTVARTEHDFCQHMRTHSCYGEINVGLNPIELSIVVNGADPAAKIKHIIAAANTLNSYVDEKEKELKKIADMEYTATLAFSDPQGKEIGDKQGQVTVKSDSLDQLKHDIDQAINQFQSIISAASEENISKDTNDAAFNQSSGTIAMQETDLPGTNFSIAPAPARYAAEGFEKELSVIKTSIESKLAHMQQDLDKLVTTFNQNEEIMSGKNDNMNKQGYFQGGGGLNEPTPGDRKYPVDPAQDSLREHDDKQMVGQKPFPDVGPVDGMYPGYESFPTGELERKKMLARADVEERRLRRLAVINKAKDALETSRKDAYFNNGLDAKNPNTPAPHQVKYPADPMNEQLREHEDKQMVGQKPFPDVGAVDGLHPSPLSADQKDELKRKKDLQRAAGLRVKFSPVKTAQGAPDYSKSTWEVYNDGKLILAKSVDEITGGGDRSEALYTTIASEGFAKDLIAKVKAVGADKVGGLFKGAQMPPPAPQGDAPQMPAMSSAGPADDKGKDGDPKDDVVEMSEKVRDLASDLAEQVKALTGEKSQMGEMDEAELPMAAAEDGQTVTTASLRAMKKAIINPLIEETKDAIANLKACESELTSLAELYDTKGAVTETNRDFVDSLAENAVADAKTAMAESFELLGAFVKFAEANEAVEERAKRETMLNVKQADGEHMKPENKEIMGILEASDQGLVDAALALDAEDGSSEESSESKADDMDALNALLADDLAFASVSSDSNDAVTTSDPAMAAQIAKQNPGLDVEVKNAALETKVGRLALRAKLAAEMKWNPILREFHPKDKALPGHLDTKPSDNLEVVENIAETHDRMMDVANAPPSVRKEAAEIQKLVSEGKLNPKDLDLLVANGVDPEAVKYWKAFWGDAGPEGKEFATELVKEHAKAQMEEEMATYRVKIARAYEFAYEMVDRELLPRNKDAISRQVNEIMQWNDQGFESFKRIVAQSTPALHKSAGRMPQVGVYGQEDAAPQARAKSDTELLTDLFSRSNPKRMF